MRTSLTTAAVLLLCGLSPAAQDPAPAGALPVRRVVLYKTGVGYFEHLGDVRGNQNITIRFTSGQLDDVLKSLTAVDLGKGQVTAISYNSVAPLERRLGALRLPLAGSTTSVEVLESLRGARLEVTSGGAVVAGRLLTVERRTEERNGRVVTTSTFSVLTDTGAMRTFELSPSIQVRLADRDLRQELGRYLDVLGSAREQDIRSMVISAAGTGARRLFVSYVSEVPIWKSTYRLVVPPKGKPFLQGWAIVDNTVGEDWTNVELSLVAGAPQAFVQRLSQPYYAHRPVVPLPPNVMLEPQTHGATLQQGRGVLSGRVRDATGAVIPGVQIRLLGPQGEVAATTTDAGGAYRVTVASGTYTLSATLTGFVPWTRSDLVVSAGAAETEDIAMVVGGISESVTVAPHMNLDEIRNNSAGRRGAPPPPPAAPPAAADAYQQLKEAVPAAAGAVLGELFEYRIKEPVTLRKNQSALVPILNAELAVEKVSLWNRPTGSGRPLRAMWLTNSSGLTLDGGSITVIEGEAFAGEGLIEPVKPGEKRLVSYAADLGVLVDARMDGAPRRTARVRAQDGVLIQETEERATWTYTARNEGAAPSTLVVEHPTRPEWKLADGQPPVESTAAAHRFRLVVAPAQEATLQVREMRPGATRISIGDISDALLVQLAATGVDGDALRRALEPVLVKKAELAALERRLQDLSSQRTRIVEDQVRLRENMKALRGSAEERQLLLRYTRQLDEQENTLASLQREIDATTASRNAARAELSQVIGAIRFDLAGRS